MHETPNPQPYGQRSPDGRAGRPGHGTPAEALTISAVVAELRRGLRAHDIRARDVIGRSTHGEGPAFEVAGMSLGDAAMLALVLNEAAASRSSGRG